MTSRVIPGWSWTMEILFRASRLKSRLLPTLGRPHPEADNSITFEIQGEGKLIGVDNGNMAEMAVDFKGNTRKVSHGLCLAMIQSTASGGQIRVTATSPGLKPATVTITSALTARFRAAANPL